MDRAIESDLLELAKCILNLIISVGDGISLVSGADSGVSMPRSLLEFIHERERDQNVNRNQLVRIVTIMSSSMKDDQKDVALCLALFCNLIIFALRSQLPKRLIQRGYTRIMQNVFTSMTCEDSTLPVRFQWRNPDDVLAVIHSRLLSHPVVHWHTNQPDSTGTCRRSVIISLVLSVFMSVAPASENNEHDLVLYQSIVGPAVENSRALKSTLLMNIPVTRDAIALLRQGQRKGFVVALFECSLELSSGGERQTIELAKGDSAMPSAEHALLDRFAAMLQHNHVQMVGCQKRIHPHLVRKLKSFGIVCISRVSVKYIGALVRLAGARLLTSIPIALDASSLGYLKSVRHDHLYGKDFVIAQGYEARPSPGESEETSSIDRVQRMHDDLMRQLDHLPITFRELFVSSVARRRRTSVTVVVTSPTETTAALWQAAIEDGVAYLRRLSNASPVVLPGKGIWLAELAHDLRRTQEGKAQSASPEPVKGRVARQTAAAERLFVDSIQACAVMAGGAQTQRHQLSSGGEGWDSTQVFGMFSDSEALLTGPLGATHTHTVLRSPDGDQVAVLNESRGNASDKETSFSSVRRLDTAKVAYPPLDSLAGSLQALRVATDLACALLDVDGIFSVAVPN